MKKYRIPFLLILGLGLSISPTFAQNEDEDEEKEEEEVYDLSPFEVDVSERRWISCRQFLGRHPFQYQPERYTCLRNCLYRSLPRRPRHSVP